MLYGTVRTLSKKYDTSATSGVEGRSHQGHPRKPAVFAPALPPAAVARQPGAGRPVP